MTNQVGSISGCENLVWSFFRPLTSGTELTVNRMELLVMNGSAVTYRSSGVN